MASRSRVDCLLMADDIIHSRPHVITCCNNMATLLCHLLGSPVVQSVVRSIECSTKMLLPPLTDGESQVFSGCLTILAFDANFGANNPRV